MRDAALTIRRCGIYTRKSSEEGLEQSFNSLDAQREACAAYIQSQKSEGWKALPQHYDDGGFSGGTMKRPALSRLLQDIATGRVDIVVVYKVDRLTRALADFAKIVEVFDRHGVSFVSVTQAFNTTSSMGRLTLNVLLSFAQFEREVTGERIRDKIAASKAKGMWMGGYPPLGYIVTERQLRVVDAEAEKVRHIFARYLALKSVNAVAAELARDSIGSKLHVGPAGRARGGTPFSRGALLHLLRNRIYVGEIVHREKTYPGQHDAIVNIELFERVQRQLNSNTVSRTKRQVGTAPLAGIVYDAAGHRMSPTHAYGKSGARYLYYISKAGDRPSASADLVCRVSARLLEELVLDRMRSLVECPGASWPDLRPWLRRVEVRASSVTLELTASDRAPDRDAAQEPHPDRLSIAACMQPRKGSTRITAPAARVSRAYLDRPLIAALKRAHRELSAHGLPVSNSSARLEHARGLADPYLRRIAPLAFLAPDIQHAILTGRQPPGLSLKRLIESDLPLGWEEQRSCLGFSECTSVTSSQLQLVRNACDGARFEGR